MIQVDRCPVAECDGTPDPTSTIEYSLPGVEGRFQAHLCAKHHREIGLGNLAGLSLTDPVRVVSWES